MSTSPPIAIEGSNPEMTARAELAYIAEIFKTTMIAMPLATLEVVTDSSYYFDKIKYVLMRFQVPPGKIVPLVITNAFLPTQIGVTPGTVSPFDIFNKKFWARLMINYNEGKTDNRRFSVAFKPENKPPFEINFEAAPDGSMLKGVEVEWTTPLKTVIDSTPRNVKELKFATKIVGIADFDQKSVNNIETALKVKLKQSLSFYLKTRGREYLKIQFYGAVGVKYEDDKFKTIGETGVLFEIPFDLNEIVN